MNQHRHPLSVLAICLGITALTVGSACCHPDSTPTAPPPPTTAVSQQALDEAVIEAALVDLVAGTDDDSQTLRQAQGAGRLTFSNRSRDWVGTLRQELQSAESDSWKTVSSSDRYAAKEAAAVVLRRVEGKQLVAPFRPKDPRISLWEDDPASTRPADPFSRVDKPGPIYAAPPGYDRQRKLAVVVFGFAWSIHSGDATYVLRFDGKKWNVVSRHFAYYV